jgi:RHS repeat-associated protein
MAEIDENYSQAGKVAVGHPVDVASGSVFTVQHDFCYPGSVTLDWQRRYSTTSNYFGSLGRGWTVPYFMHLDVLEDGYQLFDEEGGEIWFADPSNLIESGNVLVSLGANVELRREGDYLVITHWHYGSDNVERFYFKVEGARSIPLAAIQNLQGHRILLKYDMQNRLSQITQELEARVIELVYGDRDLLDSVYFIKDSGERKNIAKYQYDLSGNLLAFCDAMGALTAYQYDHKHRMTAETNCLGSTFIFKYDHKGRCIYSSGDEQYMERKLQYFSAPPMTRVTDSLGNIIDYIFNHAGLVIQEVTPIGGPWTTVYDEFGREIEQTDPLGGSVRYGYDKWGNRSSIVDENGSETLLRYNDLHVLEAYTDPMGSIWSFEHDLKGNVLASVDPLGRRQTVVRDHNNVVTTTLTAAGREVVRQHGNGFRWVETADQISLISRQEYDDEGNQVLSSDENGVVQQVRFDACHRPVEVTDKFGNAYRMRWNLLGKLVERTGPDIGWEQREYDNLGQLKRHINSLGEMQFRYDTEGKMTAAINRAGEQMQFAYDAEGRMVANKLFDGRIERREFDVRGKPVRIPMADGRDFTIEYDAAGNVVGRKSSDGLKEFFTLNRNGDLIKAETADTVVELVRNELGLVIAEVQNGQRIEYVHDADGNKVARCMPSTPGADLRVKNDVRGRMTTLIDAKGICQNYTWDNVDRIIQRSFSGGTEDALYDEEGHLQSQRVNSLGATIIERTYGYDSMDNIISLKEMGRKYSEYEYDEIGRLLKVKANGRDTENYQYDPNGSILETHRGKRLLAPGGKTLNDGQRTYAYDANGCVSKINSPELSLDLTYDVDGRLISAESTTGMSARYTYDALGRRTSKLVDGTRTDYLWEGFVLAGKTREGNFGETFYFHALDPIAQWRNGERITPVIDQVGMVREVINERGDLVAESTAQAYGLCATKGDAQLSLFRLRGQYFDEETGLHFNFHRTYDPFSGNYLSPDPIGVEGGANYYAYPRNPLLWDDPYGLSCNRASCKAEAKMTAAMKARGYTLVSTKGKSVMANGIDGIYHNPNGNPKYIIAEAKSGCAVLRWSGPKDANGKGTIQQMSDGWINGKPGDTQYTRLDTALPPTPNPNGGPPLPNPHAAAIRSGSDGAVGREVYHPDKPAPRTLPDYGGGGSSTPTI